MHWPLAFVSDDELECSDPSASVLVVVAHVAAGVCGGGITLCWSAHVVCSLNAFYLGVTLFCIAYCLQPPLPSLTSSPQTPAPAPGLLSHNPGSADDVPSPKHPTQAAAVGVRLGAAGEASAINGQPRRWRRFRHWPSSRLVPPGP